MIRLIAGWLLSLLLGCMLIFLSAGSKLTEWEGKAEEFAKLGFTPEVMFKIGVVEVTIAILFLIPRTAFLGAVLLTAYLGGATAAHVRVEDPEFFPPIIFGVLVWVALGLRQRGVFSAAIGNEPVTVDSNDELES